MFSKKSCQKCREKVSSKSNFCPECGNPLKTSNQKDYGMLGKDDYILPQDNTQNIFGGGMMNKMLNSAMKMLEKEMQKDVKELNQPKSNFELFINGKRISPDKIKVTRQPMQKAPVQKTKTEILLSDENKKKFLKLPKKEPTTSIKRLSNKIIYELNIPEVESIKDISIVQLENSIEIKALAKKIAYSKIISIGLPISNYELSEGKLILELDQN